MQLRGSTPSLTIISQRGPSMDVGGEAQIQQCVAEIDEAIRTRQAKRGRVPKEILEEMIAASVH
jgi:hypothetical protein